MVGYNKIAVEEVLAAGNYPDLCEELRYLVQRMDDLEDRMAYLRESPVEDALECWESADTISHTVGEDLASMAAVRRVMEITEQSIADVLWQVEQAEAREAARQVPGQMAFVNTGAMIAA